MSFIQFPAESVISAFTATERMLCDYLDVVPYRTEHEQVWSPRLVTILLEACSQLDSLWRSQALVSGRVKDLQESNCLNNADYYTYFAVTMAPRWVVFWETGKRVRPFEFWEHARKANPNGPVGTSWWEAYNHVKHNRLHNEKQATLKSSVEALAGLYIAIVKCEYCRDAIAAADWIFSGTTDYYRPQHHLAESKCSCPDSAQESDRLAYVTVESKLFTYPVCLGAIPEPKNYHWAGHCSNRFRAWAYSK